MNKLYQIAKAQLEKEQKDFFDSDDEEFVLKEINPLLELAKQKCQAYYKDTKSNAILEKMFHLDKIVYKRVYGLKDKDIQDRMNTIVYEVGVVQMTEERRQELLKMIEEGKCEAEGSLELALDEARSRIEENGLED